MIPDRMVSGFPRLKDDLTSLYAVALIELIVSHEKYAVCDCCLSRSHQEGIAGLSQTTTTPTVTIGGAPATVLFSGPGSVGEYKVDALVPAASSKGAAVPVVIAIGGATSNTVSRRRGEPRRERFQGRSLHAEAILRLVTC
jgi:hypothetical protein